jgi:hypothetical protein
MDELMDQQNARQTNVERDKRARKQADTQTNAWTDKKTKLKSFEKEF